MSKHVKRVKIRKKKVKLCIKMLQIIKLRLKNVKLRK